MLELSIDLFWLGVVLVSLALSPIVIGLICCLFDKDGRDVLLKLGGLVVGIILFVLCLSLGMELMVNNYHTNNDVISLHAAKRQAEKSDKTSPEIILVSPNGTTLKTTWVNPHMGLIRIDNGFVDYLQLHKNGFQASKETP